MIIVYNSRDEKAECTKALAELRHRYNPEFHGFSNGMSHEKCVANHIFDTFLVNNRIEVPMETVAYVGAV